MKRFTIAIALVCAFALAPGARAQTVAPMMGVGAVQFLDNSGQPLNSGVLYTFEAGTTIQQATYTDSTGLTANPDPVPFSAAGRASIWLTIGSDYKFVLCTQNDGAACSPGDTLFTVDNVPGGSSGGGGGGMSPFISSSSNPATTGILRLASGDTICWRNSANNANLCQSINSAASLLWAGGSLLFPEINAIVGTSGSDLLYADNSGHRWKMSNNSATVDTLVGAATTDTLTNKTYDTGATGNSFAIAGTPITGTTGSGGDVVLSPSDATTVNGVSCALNATCTVPLNAIQSDQTVLAANVGPVTLATPSADGYYQMSAYIVVTRVASSSSVLPDVTMTYTDADTGVSNTFTISIGGSMNTLGFTTSGEPSVLYAKSGVAITYSTTGYSSMGATTMQYAVHVRLQGPF